MLVICPQCKGERRYYKVNWPEYPTVTDLGAEVPVGFTVTRHLVDCERCAGSGRCEATERIPVLQDGHRVGTVPPSFDPAAVVTTSVMYQPRAGDFHFDGASVVAHTMLGPGDLESVAGFMWD